MEALIQTKEDLIHYLTSKRICNRNPPESVNVTSQLRKKVMTGDLQCRFIHKGRVREFEFKSLGGGVYSASIKSTEDK